ncbi:hypothetical protein DS835_05185 [Lactobacillus bombicola]|uniref:Uncharacterized protein n=1 Tax=Lactobacillus bombicola TaxID=1505723 RepID=A0A396T5B1_9LACO|nr:hypothetical protein DS835_05185 [Lactobacillus bombicola]
MIKFINVKRIKKIEKIVFYVKLFVTYEFIKNKVNKNINYKKIFDLFEKCIVLLSVIKYFFGILTEEI